MTEFPGSWSRTTSRVNGTRISSRVFQVTAVSPLSSSLPSNTGRSPFRSSTYPRTELPASWHTTSRTRNTLAGWTVNVSRRDGPRPIPWRLGPGRAVRMLAGTFSMTTGMRAIGKGLWALVSTPFSHSTIPLNNRVVRRISRQEASAISRMECVPTGGGEPHFREPSPKCCRTVAKNAGQLRS